VTRLVFDTQQFYRLREPVLDKLRARGFIISVSYCAFMEALNKADERQEPNIFFAPARRFAAYVDRKYPIAAVQGDLLARLGASSPDGVRPRNRVEFEQGMLRGWTFATTGDEKDPLFAQLCAGARKEVADREETWLKLTQNWKVRQEEESNEDHQRGLQILRTADPTELREAAWRYIIAVHPAPGMLPPRPAERFHAHFSVMRDRLLQSGRGAETAAGNDAQDVAQLMHVGEQAVLVTRDGRLLRSVDDSRSFQGPWVRTLVEALTEGMPSGTPWGRPGRRIAESFLRRPIEELLAEEDAMTAKQRSKP
jgi:hypothetical protein